MSEDEPGELVDGVLVEEEVPDNVHEVVLAWLLIRLGIWVEGRDGVVMGSEAKFAVTARTGRKPDLTVFFGGLRALPRRGINRRPPDIAIEVVSPTPRDARRDRVEKLREYAAFGVHYYWLVDPELRAIEILERSSRGRFSHVIALSEGVARRIPGCEGLTLDLDALWRAIDRLGTDQPKSPRTIRRRRSSR